MVAIANAWNDCAAIDESGPRTLDASVGMLGGMLHVAGHDVANATSSTVPWVGLSGALDFELELAERWSLLLAVGAMLRGRDGSRPM